MPLSAPRFLGSLILAVTSTSPATLAAQALSADEQAIVEHVAAHVDDGIDLLQRQVDINSGTLNPQGVARVADLLRPELEALGFDVRVVELPPELNRGPHLIAERQGSRGPALLLIGHLDTVFEEDSPFQRFERVDEATARGPGVVDMKGGNMVMIQALAALNAVGGLDDATITVVLTGDEESPGRPLDISRRDLIDVAQRSDFALGFEGGSRDDDGVLGVIARRGVSGWTLETTGRRAHSSTVFSGDVGAGAIFEAARILDQFYEALHDEEFVTFNPGVILGGSEVGYNDGDDGGEAAGKTNVVADRAVVRGDLRTISVEQLAHAQQRMRDIVAQHLPGTTAQITFTDGYPPMPPTDGNRALLRRLDEVNRDLGNGSVRPFDPGGRGAADVSFVAPYVDGIDGLGPFGTGSHSDEETIDLASLPEVIQRAAVFMHRLLREDT